jgi:hypothetical protein
MSRRLLRRLKVEAFSKACVGVTVGISEVFWRC